MRDNIPCREASAAKLAPDHTSKLDAVLVDPCFIQCLLARREEKRREKRREKERGERREKRKRESRTERKRERAPPRAHVQHASVCSFKTPSCEATRRPHVEHMRASCRYTRRRFESTHGGVLDMSTGGFFRAPSRATLHTFTHTHQTTHTHTTPNTKHNHTPTTTHTHHTTRTPHHTPQTHTRTTNTTTCSRQHANTTQHHTTTCTHTHHTYHTTHNTPHTTSCQCHFEFFTVTTVMSVTSVMLMRIYFFI